MADRLEAVFDVYETNCCQIWDLICDVFLVNCRDERIRFDNRLVRVKAIGDTLNRRQPGYFIAEFPGWNLDVCTSGDSKIIHVIAETDLDVATSTWQQWADSCAGVWNALINVRVYKREFEKWQNAESIQSYQLSDKRFEHLPQRPSGLPFPHNGNVIDISGNSGRRYFRNRYIEAIGSTMWLATKFFERTGSSAESFSTLSQFEVTPWYNGVKVAAKTDQFEADDFEDARNELRAALFSNATPEG